MKFSDCGWQGKARNSSGGFTWDTNVLPSGPAALGSYLHGLGLKFGVYSDACVFFSPILSELNEIPIFISGYYSCDAQGGNGRYLGSLNYEAQDAKTFASWGADYLKVYLYLLSVLISSHFYSSMITVSQVAATFSLPPSSF
jgi:alpha-galactosidase